MSLTCRYSVLVSTGPIQVLSVHSENKFSSWKESISTLKTDFYSCILPRGQFACRLQMMVSRLVDAFVQSFPHTRTSWHHSSVWDWVCCSRTLWHVHTRNRGLNYQPSLQTELQRHKTVVFNSTRTSLWKLILRIWVFSGTIYFYLLQTQRDKVCRQIT